MFAYGLSVKNSSRTRGDKTFEASKKRLQSSGGMFGYDSITVSYAWELISVCMCYSQGGELNTSLSRLCTVPTSPYL